MSHKASTTAAALVVAAALIAAGCSSPGRSSTPAALSCPTKTSTPVTGTPVAGPPTTATTARPAAHWTQPDADLASTRDVASAITSINVAQLGVAWTVPLT